MTQPASPPAVDGFIRGVSLIGMIALCVGNMVGTSVYTLPASLASTTGPLGIVAWIVTAAGYALVNVRRSRGEQLVSDGTRSARAVLRGQNSIESIVAAAR